MTHSRASLNPVLALRSWGVLLFFAASLAFGQGRTSPTSPGVWKAWRWDFENGGPTGSAATRAEVKAIADKVLALRTIIAAAPAVAQPIGFNAMLSGYFNEFLVTERPDLKGRDFPISAGLWFGAFPLSFNENGSVDWGETALLPINLNLLPRWWKAPDWWDVNTDVVLHPARYKQNVAGLPRFGNTLVLKKNPKPLWVPVSLEETLGLVVAQRRKNIEVFIAAASRARKGLEDFGTEREIRLKTYRQAAAREKDPEAFLARLQKGEREAESAIRKQVESMTPATNPAWATATTALAEAEQDLASLSPEQKTMPACLFERATSTRPLVRFGAAGAPGGRPVIRPNWDYFNRSLPRSAVQLITIGDIDLCVASRKFKDSPNRYGSTANMALLESLDWNKVWELVD